jgi:transposase, IS5 family
MQALLGFKFNRSGVLNLQHIANMFSVYLIYNKKVLLTQINLNYLETIKIVYAQQFKMHSMKKHTIENRIVNIHQSHVRPIVRGKSGVKVEFGSKLQVSMVNGYAFLDKLSWNNFNESQTLKLSVKNYKKSHGYYPAEVLADQIYCNRENRNYLKALNIELKSKPLGRPPKDKALSILVSPGERNPIEGKFGQGKVGYGMNNIRAKLKSTSESWVALIFLVLNLVNLTRLKTLCAYYINKIIIICNFGSLKMVA